MKNATIPATPKDRALAAIDALIDSPHQLHNFSAKELFIDVIGGREHCLDGTPPYEFAEALRALLPFCDDKHMSAYSRAARHILQSLLNLYDVSQGSPQFRASITRWIIEMDDNDNNDRMLSDAHLDNIARRHELLLELGRLEAEERNIKYGSESDTQKEAA